MVSEQIITRNQHNGNTPLIAPLVAHLEAAYTPKTKTIMVELTQTCRTAETGLIVPTGTRGRVVGLHTNDTGEWDVTYWLIDFGLPTVVIMPYDSPLLKILKKGEW